MRIGINARTLASPHIRGWGRYIVQLARYLPEFGAELVLFTDQPLDENHLALLEPGTFRVEQSPKLSYLAWEQVWLPFAAARSHLDIIHAPANFGLPVFSKCPRVLTLHDAIDVAFDPLTSPAGFRERLIQGSFWVARRSADAVITVSQHAKNDIAKHLAVPKSRLIVVYEASDLFERAAAPATEQLAVDSLGLPAGPFILYAGGFERRKNVDFLLDGFRAARLAGVSLVLAGSNPPGWLREKILSQRDESPERLTGFVSDSALAGLYRRALAFVYPSLYEGFGLQLCEAMSFGCPVLSSDATSLPEILGDGGELFSPRSAEQLTTLLRRVSQDEAFRADLSNRASHRSRDFSWRETARQTWEVYRSIG